MKSPIKIVTLLLLAAVGAAPQKGVSEPPPSPGMVVIDGAKNPDQLPEYSVWETGFRELSDIKSKNLKLALASLLLTPHDHELVYTAAAAQYTRDEACAKDQRKVRQALGPAVKPSVLDKELKKVILECRWQVLEAKDRLLSELSDDGRVALITWMDKGRATMKAYTPKSELDFYRQPR